jgi:hypothetical protein
MRDSVIKGAKRKPSRYFGCSFFTVPLDAAEAASAMAAQSLALMERGMASSTTLYLWNCYKMLANSGFEARARLHFPALHGSCGSPGLARKWRNEHY